MTLDEAKQMTGHLVRVKPGALKGRDWGSHWARAKVIGVNRRTVTVQIFGRKMTDEVAPEHLNLWHAQEPAPPAVPETPVAKPVEKSMNALPEFKRDPAAAPFAVAVIDDPQSGQNGASAPQLSDVIADLTGLLQLVRGNEATLKAAEHELDAATKAKEAAEAKVMDAMGAVEMVKSKVRTMRSALDGVLASV